MLSTRNRMALKTYRSLHVTRVRAVRTRAAFAMGARSDHLRTQNYILCAAARGLGSV